MAEDDGDDRILTKDAFKASRLGNDLRFVRDGSGGLSCSDVSLFTGCSSGVALVNYGDIWKRLCDLQLLNFVKKLSYLVKICHSGALAHQLYEPF